MPSFDIVSQVDMQEVDNAVNNTLKELQTRFDFRGTRYQFTFDKKEKKIHLVADDTMKMEAMREIFAQKAAKRKLDLKTFDYKDVAPGAGGQVKRDILIRDGLESDMAKRIVKIIKDRKLKVQAAIQGDQVRVTGKQIDDLQTVIATLKEQDLEVPLQYINMKR